MAKLKKPGLKATAAKSAGKVSARKSAGRDASGESFDGDLDAPDDERDPILRRLLEKAKELRAAMEA